MFEIIEIEDARLTPFRSALILSICAQSPYQCVIQNHSGTFQHYLIWTNLCYILILLFI